MLSNIFLILKKCKLKAKNNTASRLVQHQIDTKKIQRLLSFLQTFCESQTGVFVEQGGQIMKTHKQTWVWLKAHQETPLCLFCGIS